MPKSKVFSSIFKVIIGIILVTFLLAAGLLFWIISRHDDSPLNIGNSFNQPVTAYLEGKKMGKIEPGASRIFDLNKVLTITNSDLLIELKSNSNVALYSRLFSGDELHAVLESVKGQPYWIGSETTVGIYLADTGELVLSQDDIKAYYGNSHSIELNAQGIAKWNSFHTYAGVPKLAQSLFNREFIIKSNGKEICRGKFYSLASSATYSGIAIIDALLPLDGEHDQIWIISDYPNNTLGTQYDNVSLALVTVFGELNLLR
jgi:hypothetical protein